MENKMSSEDTSYVELQKKIDESTPTGFPASEDGTEIKILKLLFSPEEADIAKRLGGAMEPLGKIHGRINKGGISLSLNELDEVLDGLVERGNIIGFEREGTKYYSLVQWVVGFFESQLGKMTKEFAEHLITSKFDVLSKRLSTVIKLDQGSNQPNLKMYYGKRVPQNLDYVYALSSFAIG